MILSTTNEVNAANGRNDIARIELAEFQSHRRTVLEPAPGGQLTVITGPSDSGKTAIIRGVRWALRNEPDGADFIRVGAQAAAVSICYADGRRVVRERSRGGVNRFKALDCAGRWQTFEGFGRGVPLEVEDITGVCPVLVGDQRINLHIADQLAGPFLGAGMSAPARAKVLGKLAGTEEVDHAARQTVSDVRERKIEARRLEAEIARLDGEIGTYSWLPGAAEKIAALERIVGAIRTAQERRQRVALLGADLQDALAGIQRQEEVLRRLDGVAAAMDRCRTAEEGAARAATLRFVAGRFQAVCGGVARSQTVIDRWSGLEDAVTAYAEALAGDGRTRMLRHQTVRLATALNGMAASEGILRRWADVDAVRATAQSVEAAVERRATLVRCAEGRERADAQIAAQEKTLERLAGLDATARMTTDAAKWIPAKAKLFDLAIRLKQADAAVNDGRLRVVRWEGVAEAERLYAAAREIGERRAYLAALVPKLNGLGRWIEEARGAAVLAENRVAELQGAYRDQLSAAGVCPLCGQEITTQILRRAI